jgi:enoyl-CoA hydratase/carnithine racemase
MSQLGSIEYRVEGGVARLTIANPSRANSLTYPMMRRLADCWTEAAKDDAVRVAVLTGEGKRHFCAGADLNLVHAEDTPFAPDAEHNQTSLTAGFPKPVVALVNGPAIGLGMQLAIDCDIVLATRHAYFLEPRTSYGRPPVSVLQLATELGFSELVRLGVAGLPMNADRAYGLGIVSELVDNPDELEGAAQPYLKKLTDQGAEAVANSLALLRSARRRPGVAEAQSRANDQIQRYFQARMPAP